MATLREWLDAECFDWVNGKIIYQWLDPVHDYDYVSLYPGWQVPNKAKQIGNDHDMLDLEFSDCYGAPECPRFIAEDECCIYFPSKYDGSTRLEKVHKYIDVYLNPKTISPYPGGG